MAFPQQLSLSPSQPYSLLFRNSPKLPFRTSIATINASSSSSSSLPMAATEQAVLDAVAQSEGNTLPCVRSYENDMARLSLSGAVGFEQALTAAAADGGKSASEHVESGLPAMVVETVYPGTDDEHSTVSTRLFLPARKVKEKARRLRSSLSKDILSSTNSRNILAMTFRQVVIQQLWNYDLAIFVPESQRNMEDLGSQREVAASFSLSSSNEEVISRLAEAVCSLALDSTQEEFMNESSSGKAWDGFSIWLSKPKQFTSNDASVVIFRYVDEIVENAESLLEKFNMARAQYRVTNNKLGRSAWPSLLHSELEKIGGSEFGIWAREYVPAYRIEIDADRLTELKLEGWQRTTGNKWQMFLTHTQMVGLANIIDMYFEDVHTLPSKQLSCNFDGNPKNLPRTLRGFTLFGFLRTILIPASVVLTVCLMAKLWLPQLYNSRRGLREHQLLASTERVREVEQLAVDSSKLEAFCSATVVKMKDYYGWIGDIKYEPHVGAWIGELPIYFRTGYGADSTGKDTSSTADLLATGGEEQKSDIANYQVFLSRDGSIVRLQPTNEVAVQHSKEMHGLLEAGLTISEPDEAVVLDLLMSQNEDYFFALVRPLK